MIYLILLALPVFAEDVSDRISGTYGAETKEVAKEDPKNFKSRRIDKYHQWCDCKLLGNGQLEVKCDETPMVELQTYEDDETAKRAIKIQCPRKEDL